MARPSIALFLVTAGLVASPAACGKAPEPKAGEGGEAKVHSPAPAQAPAAPAQKEGEGGEGGEG